MTNKPTIKDSLLLCASDLQHSAIYDNHIEMQSCIRAVADRITALASVIDGVGRAALVAPAQAEAPAGVEAVGEMRASDSLGVAPYADIWGWLQPGTKLYSATQVQAMLAAQAQPVATIYVTEDGSREVDDWKVELPVGATTLYTAAQAATAKQSPHPEYDKGFSDGWNRREERQAAAPASQPFAYEFSRSNGDGTHSEHIERGRLQEVAPGRWEHSGLPRGALADKPIKALYTTPQTQPAAIAAKQGGQ